MKAPISEPEDRALVAVRTGGAISTLIRRKPGLQVEITVDDPAVFTTRWSALATYGRVQGEWPEAVCAENTHGSGTSSVGTSSSSTCIFSNCLVPQAVQPDF